MNFGSIGKMFTRVTVRHWMVSVVLVKAKEDNLNEQPYLLMTKCLGQNNFVNKINDINEFFFFFFFFDNLPWCYNMHNLEI